MKKKFPLFIVIILAVAVVSYFIGKQTGSVDLENKETTKKSENFEKLQKQRQELAEEENKKEITDTLVRIDESFTDSEIEKLTEEDFIEYLDEIRVIVPTNQQLQAMDSSQVHHFPVQVMEVGYRMGIIKRILALRPEFHAEAIEFYNVCSQENDYPTAIRALCLTNLLKDDPSKINMDDYPEDVRELAKSALEL
jgi:type III secretory pathway component EscV